MQLLEFTSSGKWNVDGGNFMPFPMWEMISKYPDDFPVAQCGKNKCGNWL
jgi:hypothetical protein